MRLTTGADTELSQGGGQTFGARSFWGQPTLQGGNFYLWHFARTIMPPLDPDKKTPFFPGGDATNTPGADTELSQVGANFWRAKLLGATNTPGGQFFCGTLL